MPTKPRKRSQRPSRTKSASCLVRRNVEAKRKLDALRRTDETATELMSRAIELLRRQRYFEALSASYARMTPAEWQQERAERAQWNATLADGEKH
jgi:hypothetical protein